MEIHDLNTLHGKTIKRWVVRRPDEPGRGLRIPLAPQADGAGGSIQFDIVGALVIDFTDGTRMEIRDEHGAVTVRC